MKRILLLAGIGLGIYAISLGSTSVKYAGTSECSYSKGSYIQSDTIPKDTSKSKKRRDTSSAVISPMPLR